MGFGIWAFISHQPSTLTYVLSAPAGIMLIGWFRREALPDLLAFALAAHAVLHLSGGLIRVGDDVLYNAAIGPYAGSLRTHVLQYDHLVHAFGSFVGTLTLWTLLVPDTLKSPVKSPGSSSRRRDVVVLCVLAGLGIGRSMRWSNSSRPSRTAAPTSADTTTADGISSPTPWGRWLPPYC